MTDTAALHAASSWLSNLATLTRHKRKSPTPDELRAQKEELALYATMLARDFPAAAFTSDSLHWVSRGKTYWPACEEIRQPLRDWWAIHRPRDVLALAGAGEQDLTVPEQCWVNTWQSRMAEISALPDKARAAFERDRLESLIRSQSAKAYQIITGKQGVRV